MDSDPQGMIELENRAAAEGTDQDTFVKQRRVEALNEMREIRITIVLAGVHCRMEVVPEYREFAKEHLAYLAKLFEAWRTYFQEGGQRPTVSSSWPSRR